MSTRCVTVINECTEYGTDEPRELLRFYRHCDGYPSGQGVDLARAVIEMQKERRSHWTQDFLAAYMSGDGYEVEVEPSAARHSDIEYKYVLNHVRPKEPGGSWFRIDAYTFDGTSYDQIFSGTPEEVIERIGGEA